MPPWQLLRVRQSRWGMTPRWLLGYSADRFPSLSCLRAVVSSSFLKSATWLFQHPSWMRFFSNISKFEFYTLFWYFQLLTTLLYNTFQCMRYARICQRLLWPSCESGLIKDNFKDPLNLYVILELASIYCGSGWTRIRSQSGDKTLSDLCLKFIIDWKGWGPLQGPRLGWWSC